MGLEQVSSNVFQAIGDPYLFTEADEQQICRAAIGDKMQRARINIHTSDSARVHEMIIAFTNKSIVLPHYHPGKKESFHVLRGKIRIEFFDPSGKHDKNSDVTLDSDIGPVYYRLQSEKIHQVVPLSELCLIHEVTDGPFIKGKSSVFPSWSKQ